MSHGVNPTAGQGLGRGRGRQPTFDHDEAIALYRELGWSVARIARHYEVTDMTIYRMLKKHGVKLHWTRKTTVCRNGHARMFWGYVDRSGKWRCRRCQRGADVGHLFLVQVYDNDLRRQVNGAIFSTLDLAVQACPRTLDWAVVEEDEDGNPLTWVAEGYTIVVMMLDPSFEGGKKL